mmetsp:Transcript_13525/g.33165  ORF Transcript_13525/g.33165 Transcript_13525/m.33165 type:complete len:252 (+) Transcript_13525:2006-2761(+)
MGGDGVAVAAAACADSTGLPAVTGIWGASGSGPISSGSGMKGVAVVPTSGASSSEVPLPLPPVTDPATAAGCSVTVSTSAPAVTAATMRVSTALTAACSTALMRLRAAALSEASSTSRSLSASFSALSRCSESRVVSAFFSARASASALVALPFSAGGVSVSVALRPLAIPAACFSSASLRASSRAALILDATALILAAMAPAPLPSAGAWESLPPLSDFVVVVGPARASTLLEFRACLSRGQTLADDPGA